MTLSSSLIERELKKRSAPLPDVLSECFPEQLDFIKHPSKRKKACLTRRCGKSYTAGLYLINEALTHPRSKSVYVTLTKTKAKEIMWTDIFENIILKLKIPAKLVGLHIQFTNGSIIYLTGADSTYKEKEKLRGQKNILAVIDECQSFEQDLEKMVESILLPTLADSNGTLVMLGTPGNNMGLHYWWQLNNPENNNSLWKDFYWNWESNTHVKNNVKKEIDAMKAKDPNIINRTSFRQEWLGEWVIESSARVYLSGNNNYIDFIPPEVFTRATYLLSIDLGYVDATAFVISAYNRYFNDKLYIVESLKVPGLTITAVANKIKDYQKRYNFHLIVVDAANRQAVEEMRIIHGLPLYAADKQGKEGHIALLNSDFQTSNVHILRHTNDALIKELESLIWDQHSLLLGKHKEDARKDNHLCFIAGTKIQTINGPQNIEDIKVGDLILTRKGYKPAIWSGETGTKEIYHLKTKQGRELFATKTHPIFVNNKLIPLEELKCGDILTCIEVQIAPKHSDTINILNKNIVADYVSIVEMTNQKQKVYNLTVQDQHEYFANGILVSNTDALLYSHHASRHYWFQPKIIINPDSEDELKKRLIDNHIALLNQKQQPFEVNYEADFTMENI